jgi:signal transduction histidine kinase
VAERTADLAEVNESLKAEIARHQQTDAARSEAVQQLINAKEAERHRLARELHDRMGQHLTALMLGLKMLRDGAAGKPELSSARERLQQLQELADLMGREIHHLALELRPTALDDLGLHTALSGPNAQGSGSISTARAWTKSACPRPSKRPCTAWCRRG